MMFMINNYEIKLINNEEVLYLYLNLDNEFGKNISNKSKKLNNVIKDYLKKNKINFKGSKIAIVVGGLLIGTLILDRPVNNESKVSIDNYTISLIESYNPVEEVIKIDEVIEEETKVESKKKTPIKNTETSKNNDKSVTTSKKTSTYSDENKTNIKESNTYVTIKRNNGLITQIELEEYVIGVVGAEMPASFNIEALKAQAIIARTYAINTLNKGKILTDDSSTQNYKDESELKKMWNSNYETYYKKIKSAVESTKGVYLTYNGEIIDAVYHSTSNGQTEDAKYVWGNNKPYLVSVDSPYDTTNKSFNYEKFIAYSSLTDIFKMEIDINSEFNILSKTSSNRVDKISINDKIYTGVEIRTLLQLRSTDFEINKEENGISFKTKGYGHGVGLSQYGANGMANSGFNYEQILKHYYTGVKLTKI